MSGTLATAAGGLLARYDRLRSVLPGDAEARSRAAATIRRRGLPSPRDEAWRYTNLKALAEIGGPRRATSADVAELLQGLPVLDAAATVVLVDGRLRRDLSRVPDTLAVASFAEHPLTAEGLRPERETLVAANEMLAEDGALIDVSAGRDAGLVLLASIGTGAEDSFHPRHSVRLAEGAKLTLFELSIGSGRYLHNPVFSVELAKDAVLTHVRLQDEPSTAVYLSTTYVAVDAAATYDSFTLNLGARLGRTEVHATLRGERAVTHLNAAQLLSGTQHGDVTTVVSHIAPSCASRQTVKNVLSAHARAVFQGKIEVARGAQKTDGYQMNQTLLLSPDAEVDSKPQLEIYADDVKCSHGVTIGALDADQMFYLRSRGIGADEARSILVRAFLAAALDAVGDEQVRGVLEAAIEGWWARQPA